MSRILATFLLVLMALVAAILLVANPVGQLLAGWTGGSAWTLLAEESKRPPLLAAVHPAIVAGFQLLVSLTALVAFASDEEWM